MRMFVLTLKRLVFCLLFYNRVVVGAREVTLSRRDVSSCPQLRKALETREINFIDIIASFDCDASSWNRSVVIDHDVSIQGRKQRGIIPQIHWGTSSERIIAGANSNVVFRDLIFLQHDMGIGSIDILFFKAAENATAKFEFVVVGVISCPFKLNVTSLEHLARPTQFPGKQKGRQINENTVEASDIVLFWSNRNAIWHLYQVIFTCNVLTNDSSLLSYYKLTVMSAQTYNNRARDKSADDGSRNAGKLLVYVLLTFCSVVGFLLIIWVLATWYKHTRRDRWTLQLDAAGSKTYDENEADDDNHLHEETSHNKTSPTPENWAILDSDVALEEPLGHGEFGRVYRGCWQGTTVAVKVIRHNELCLQTNVGGPLEAFFARHISHPNVVQTYQISRKSCPTLDSPTKYFGSPSQRKKTAEDRQSGSASSELFGSFDDDNIGQLRDANYETWLILEYCDKGSLENAVAAGIFRQPKRASKFRMSFVAKTALEIASAMNYLHSVRIIHGDLKLGNVLLKGDTSDPRGFKCKVGDFGLSRFLAEDSHIETFTCGTVTHMPPELLKGGVLTSAADVYSFAILLWELLSGKKAYQGKNQGEIVLAVVNNGSRPAFPPNLPKDFMELIESCWRQDHLHRPIFPEIIDDLSILLQRYEKEEGLERGARSSHATAKQMARSSFFDPLRLDQTDSANGRQRSIRFVPKKASSVRVHQTHTTIVQSATFLDSNRSLHLSLDGHEPSSDKEEEISSIQTSRSADGAVSRKSSLQETTSVVHHQTAMQ